MRPNPLRSRTVVMANRAAYVRISAATEISPDRMGCNAAGANCTSASFKVTKIWSISFRRRAKKGIPPATRLTKRQDYVEMGIRQEIVVKECWSRRRYSASLTVTRRDDHSAAK